MVRLRIELDELTAERLRALAARERRPAVEEAAVILARALARRSKRTPLIDAQGDGR